MPKLSEFRENRLDFWQEEWGFTGRTEAVRAQAHLDILAAEAAGVVWDPEEREWGGKISLQVDAGDRLRLADREDTGNFWAVLESPYLSVSPERQKEIARTVIRRNNAWPELERLLTEEASFSRGLVATIREARKILESGK